MKASVEVPQAHVFVRRVPLPRVPFVAYYEASVIHTETMWVGVVTALTKEGAKRAALRRLAEHVVEEARRRAQT